MNNLLLFLESFLTKTYFYKINNFLHFLFVNGMGIYTKFSLVHKGYRMLMTKLLKSSGKQVVIDLGANVDNYTEELLNHDPKAKFYAFEPHPKTFITSQEKGENPGFKTLKKDCADTTNKLKFYDYTNNDGSEHIKLLEGELFTDLCNNETIVHEVDVTTLDAFIQEHKIEHIDLPKINAEGIEYGAMGDCLESIKNKTIKAMYFELNNINIIIKALVKYFSKMLPQYDFYRVLPKGLLKTEQNKVLLTEIFGFQNIVAVTKQK